MALILIKSKQITFLLPNQRPDMQWYVQHVQHVQHVQQAFTISVSWVQCGVVPASVQMLPGVGLEFLAKDSVRGHHNDIIVSTSGRVIVDRINTIAACWNWHLFCKNKKKWVGLLSATVRLIANMTLKSTMSCGTRTWQAANKVDGSICCRLTSGFRCRWGCET